MHVCEIRPRADKRGIDLISDVLPFGPLWYAVKVRTVKRIRGQPGGRFRKYNEMRKFSVRLVNGPQQI
jgi:hypothetical protein